jgi:hypothetical protein
MNNDIWDLEGYHIKAVYLDEFDVSGVVELSRVRYGGGVCHTIKLESPINVYGSVRDRCIVQHEDVTQLKEINDA